jgi:hypothetical protein
MQGIQMLKYLIKTKNYGTSKQQIITSFCI